VRRRADGAVLLVQFDFGGTTVWSTPGGGIHPGESPHVALRRELIEELGLHVEEFGPHLWTRTHIVPMGDYDGQREVVHLVEVDDHIPRPAFTTEELAAEHVVGMRWWTEAELRQLTDRITAAGDPHAHRVRIAPSALSEFLADLRAHGAPEAPWDVGV
jgi:8-oxo-dGTP diphosphatase